MKRQRITQLSALALVACTACDSGDGSADATSSQGSSTSSDAPTTSATDGESATGTAADDLGSTGADDASSGESGSANDCTDEIITDLGLVSGSVSAGAVTNMPDGSGWSSVIDATAGGITEAPTSPWIYLRFSSDGLQKVELDDFEALESTEWDIAAKRFGIRLNGGVSGPSTVAAVELPRVTYEDLTALPDGAVPEVETFYDDSCVLVDDGAGQGAPDYRLTPWWAYTGCVATTAIPFVIELSDGQHVKLVVDSYYGSGQDECNESGAMGMGSANYGWRWSYLDE